MKELFIRVYASWKRETEGLSHEEKGRLIDGLIDYLETGQEKKPEGNERFIYPGMIDRIKREQETHNRKERERAEARRK